MKALLRTTALGAMLAFATTGCHPYVFPAVVGTAIITAAIVSTRPPPPPRVVYVPVARPGFSWQPGYWTIELGDWVWMDGQWIADTSGYHWEPTMWIEESPGRWRLVPGRWVLLRGAPPPPSRW
jgi:hypothetical protein